MIPSGGARKVGLTAHVLASVGWMGAVAGFLALAVAGIGADPLVVRAVYLVLPPLTNLVVVPFSLAAGVTGLALALGTHWGLVRHYWVLIKFATTVVAIVVLLLQLDSIALLAEAATRDEHAGADLATRRTSLVVHSAGGLVVLLIPLVLSIVKPRGRTGLGRRTRTAAGVGPTG